MNTKLSKTNPYNKACYDFPTWKLNGISGISLGASDGWWTGVLYILKNKNEDILAVSEACFDVYELKKPTIQSLILFWLLLCNFWLH